VEGWVVGILKTFLHELVFIMLMISRPSSNEIFVFFEALGSWVVSADRSKTVELSETQTMASPFSWLVSFNRDSSGTSGNELFM
jgi:hypothetical protein